MKKETYKLFSGIFETLMPPPDYSLSQWADEYRRLSSESSVEPGRWRTGRAPYQKEIMNAVSDGKTRKVVVMSCSQIGKTDAFILNPVGFFMQYDPSPIMIMEPTKEMGESLSKDRLSPMLRDTPSLSDKVDDKSRSAGNTIMHKMFPGGHLTIVGANSPNALAMRPIRILLADEVDRYPPSAGVEGDPLLLATKRTTTFWNSKCVVVSSPANKGKSRIETEFEHSTKEEWNLPCPECGKYQPLSWEQIKYDKENPDSAVYHICRYCGAAGTENQWKKNSGTGKYIAENPHARTRGFHLNSLASSFCTWRETADKYEEADESRRKGNPELMKTWVNTEMGLPWENTTDEISFEEIAGKSEKYGCEVPDGVLYITCGVDTQDDRFEMEVVGWGEEAESWGLYYSIIYGDLKKKKIWDELDEYLSQTFSKKDGTKLPISCTCIDAGGHFYNEVCRFCKDRTGRKIFAIKGRGGAETPYVSKPTRNNRVGTPLFTLGVDTGKTLIYQRLSVKEPGGGYCHFPKEKKRGYDELYFKGLTAEHQVVKYKKGWAVYAWELKSNDFRRNEPFDCRDYASAALEIANPQLSQIKTKEHPRRTAKKGRKTRSAGI